MKWNTWLLFGLGLLVPVVFVLWPREAEKLSASGAAVTDLGVVHKINAQGFVPADPSVLSAAAGVSDNVYALASMMRSEAGGTGLASETAVAWAAVNHARKRGESIFRLLTRAGKNAVAGDPSSFVPNAGDGYYGHGGRYAVTSKPPSQQEIDVAADVLAGAIEDPTGGADQFDTPNADLEDVDAVAAKRQAAGKELVTVDGVAAFRFWRAT